MIRFINSFREAVNLKLYKSKSWVSTFLNYLSILVSLGVLGSLLYYYGYPRQVVDRDLILLIVHISLGFYVFKYVLGYVYSFQPLTYFQETWREGLAIGFILLNGFSILFFNINFVEWMEAKFDFPGFNDFIIGFIQIYLLVLVAFELGKSTTVFNRVSISPPVFFVLSLATLISIGTVLLMLPEMNSAGKGSFLDALFTSISASCITGLSVVDIGTYYTFKGQMVILILIQLGGLNIITFATMLAFLARNGIGLRFQSVVQGSVSADSPENSKRIFRQMIAFVFSFELFGTIGIFYAMKSSVHVFDSFADHVFFSVFHSVSAFNHAGFSTMEGGMENPIVQNMVSLQWVVIILIFLGSFGFSNLGDISTTYIRRWYHKERWRKMRIDTKVSIWTALPLTLAGLLLILIFEYNNVLAEMNWVEKITASVFHSVTLRSAGLAVIDVSTFSVAVVVAFIFFMFIGGAPGSLSGGIKTNTFFLLFVSAYGILRGKPRLEVFRHTISTDLLQRAFAIFLFTLSLITGGIFLLAYFEPEVAFVDLMFEQVSALCNVGLSRGISADLSTPARIVIMVSIFIGRTGALTLAFALLKPKRYKNYQYPSAHITVG
jgi:trk system potassium uptake protein TrkH